MNLKIFLRMEWIREMNYHITVILFIAELYLWRKEENLLANKILKFELNPESVKIKKILRKDFLEVELRAISTAYPNRNNSHFTRESLIKAIPTVYNKPLLGSFSVDDNDFR